MKPDINFGAKSFVHLLKVEHTEKDFRFLSQKVWVTMIMTEPEPSLTSVMSMERIANFMVTPLRTAFLCHTQPVEIGVKLTSRSVKKLSGSLRQSATSTVVDTTRKIERNRLRN